MTMNGNMPGVMWCRSVWNIFSGH